MTDQTGIIVAEGAVAQEADNVGQAQSLTQEAWRELRRNPLFIISLILIAIFLVMAVFPGLFTNTDPAKATLKLSATPPSADQWFGRDLQGYDVYARTIYGARASIVVGVMATLCTSLLGVIIGTLAAFYGGILDTLVMRLTDVFFAIPFLLGGILFMSTFPNTVNSGYWSVVSKVVLALSILGWPGIARLMRSAVLADQAERIRAGGPRMGALSPFRVVTQSHPAQCDGPRDGRLDDPPRGPSSRRRRRCPSSASASPIRPRPGARRSTTRCPGTRPSRTTCSSPRCS
jgi:oligopeptide transport system permease protein